MKFAVDNLPLVIHGFLLVGFCLTAFACERRTLVYHLEAEVEIRVDWSTSGLDKSEASYGATALFYPEEGGAPRVVLMGNRDYEKTRLPVGRYNVIVFNRSFDDFSATAFRGMESYQTFEAYFKPGRTRAGGSSPEKSEKLAATGIKGFEVTENGLAGPGSKAGGLELTPQKRMEEVNIALHLEGLNNIRSASARIDRVYGSIRMADGQFPKETSSCDFDLQSPTYDAGSTTNGKMAGRICVFGIPKEEVHTIHIEALLADGKTVYRGEIQNVTLVEQGGTEDGEETMVVEASFPEKVPDVVPEGNTGSGIGANVNGWGDGGETEIPV